MIIQNRDEYRSLKALNYSGLKKLLVSPLHYKTSIEAPEEQTKALRIGSYIHALVLETGEAVKSRFAVAPACDRRTKEGKAVYEAFCAGAEGKTILTNDEAEEAAKIAESVAWCNLIGQDKFLHTELMLSVEEDGVRLKSAIDAIGKDGFIYDLKTCEDASPKGFLSSVRAYRYNLQAYFYTTVVNLALRQHPEILPGFKSVAGFRFVAVEKSPPYAVAVYTIGPELTTYAIMDFEKGLKEYKSCVALDDWPGFSKEVQVIDIGSEAKASTTISFA